MPEENTWETASQDTPTPEPAAPAAETPVEAAPADTPAANPETLEAAPPPLAVEETARESESQPEPEKVEADEDVEEGDTPEILALPSKSSSRKWARRQFHDAAPLRTFLDIEKPIQAFGDDLYKRSASRYFEHVKDVSEYHKDDIARQWFGMSFEDAKARLQQPNGQPAQTVAKTAITTTTNLPTVDELNAMSNEEVAQKFQEVQAAERATLEKEKAELAKKVEELQQQFEAVNGKFQTKEQEQFQAQVNQETNKLYDKVWTSVIDGGIRDSGLEVQATDPPRIANLKRAAAHILKSETEPTFDSDESNKKLVAQVVGFAKRGEFHNAWREEDNLTVRARAAFEKVKSSDEVKTIFDEIEAYANQSNGKSRAVNPIPPAPGSSTGINIKPAGNWDELEQQLRGASA